MAKGSIKIARKYARALAELYQPTQLPEAEQALLQAASVIGNNHELSSALTNPAFNIDQRIAALAALAEKIKPGDSQFVNFLCVICKAGRIKEMPVIAEAFQSIVNEIRKLLSLKITSAFALPQEEKDSFKSKIEKEFGALATIEWGQDSDIIGGLKVRAGDKVLDGSLRGALKKMEDALLA